MSSSDERVQGMASPWRCQQWLAGSSAVAFAGSGRLAEAFESPNHSPDPMMRGPHDLNYLISSPKEAINIFDFEPVTKEKLPPGHSGYMASGIDDEVTPRDNREDFLRVQLRPRRLVDVSKGQRSSRRWADACQC